MLASDETRWRRGQLINRTSGGRAIRIVVGQVYLQGNWPTMAAWRVNSS
jgi:hypothetical protein